MSSMHTRQWGDTKIRECSICLGKFRGMGNNAEPFSGRCCDECNTEFVIPARLKRMGNNPARLLRLGKDK